MPETNTAEEVKTKKNSNIIYAIGRRKQAAARIRLYKDIKGAPLKKGLPAGRQGEITVNGKKIEEYFPGELSKLYYLDPLKAINAENKFVFTIKVAGGGINSQLDAVMLGISRALVKLDEKNKPILRKKGFLTTDARVRERRKVGTGGKARRKKQSPKR